MEPGDLDDIDPRILDVPGEHAEEDLREDPIVGVGVFDDRGLTVEHHPPLRHADIGNRRPFQGGGIASHRRRSTLRRHAGGSRLDWRIGSAMLDRKAPVRLGGSGEETMVDE